MLNFDDGGPAFLRCQWDVETKKFIVMERVGEFCGLTAGGNKMPLNAQDFPPFTEGRGKGGNEGEKAGTWPDGGLQPSGPDHPDQLQGWAPGATVLLNWLDGSSAGAHTAAVLRHSALRPDMTQLELESADGARQTIVRSSFIVRALRLEVTKAGLAAGAKAATLTVARAGRVLFEDSVLPGGTSMSGGRVEAVDVFGRELVFVGPDLDITLAEPPGTPDHRGYAVEINDRGAGKTATLNASKIPLGELVPEARRQFKAKLVQGSELAFVASYPGIAGRMTVGEVQARFPDLK